MSSSIVHTYYNSHVLQPFNFPPFPPLVYILFPLQLGIMKVHFFMCTNLNGLTIGNDLMKKHMDTDFITSACSG